MNEMKKEQLLKFIRDSKIYLLPDTRAKRLALFWCFRLWRDVALNSGTKGLALEQIKHEMFQRLREVGFTALEIMDQYGDDLLRFKHDCPCCSYASIEHGWENVPEIEYERSIGIENGMPVHPFMCAKVCPLGGLWPDGCERGDSPYLRYHDDNAKVLNALAIYRYAKQELQKII